MMSADPFPPALHPVDEQALEQYGDRYRQMLGFVPPRVHDRLAQLAAMDPEWLELQEGIRARALNPASLDDKTVQLVLFGILVNRLSDASVTHGLAARRAGASWEELQSVINLAYLFGGQSCANRGAEFLALVAEREARGVSDG